MDQAADVEVVEEPLDVKKEESSNVTAFDTSLDCVDHAQDHVTCCMIIAGPKLSEGEQLEACSIEQDAFRDDSLQEFTTAL